MKTLQYYKNRYRAVKTYNTKAKIMNGAQLNLSHSDFEKFIAWQINYMNGGGK